MASLVSVLEVISCLFRSSAFDAYSSMTNPDNSNTATCGQGHRPNTASSMEVPPGCKAVAFADQTYNGKWKAVFRLHVDFGLGIRLVSGLSLSIIACIVTIGVMAVGFRYTA